MKCYFLVLIPILCLDCRILFAEDVSLASRENAMLMTLDYLREKQLAVNREEAIDTAMKEAGKKIVERKVKQIFHPHPYITQELSFNDNLDNTKPKSSSLINKFTPGFKMNFRGQGNSLRLDTRLINIFYNNRSNADSGGAEIDALGNFSIRRYTLSIDNDYLYNYHIAKQSVADDTNAQIDWKNTFSSRLGRDFNRIGFDMGYKRIDDDYISSQSSSDSTEETFSFNPYLRIAKKTRALLEYSHKRIKYDAGADPDDSGSNDFNLSLTSVLSAKLAGLAKIGYKLTDYKVSADSRDTTFTGAVGYKVSERSNLALTLKRLIHEESNKADYYTENDFKLSGNHRLAFNQKFNLFFSYGADYFDYPKKVGLIGKTNEHIWDTELTYAFRQWLDFSLKYKNTWVHSNVDTEYDKNEITFKTNARF